MYKFSLNTDKEGLYNITKEVEEAVYDSGKREGLCVVYCPHTTAAITINENCDEDVCKVITFALNKVFQQFKEYKHDEGNSDGHIKSSLIGVSQTLLIDNYKLVLGTWQGIFLAEFDPPRNRNFYVKII